ncbi:MAG: ABC transporter permease [Halobacteriaceae archaeon]
MRLFPLVRKELIWSRQRTVLLAFLFLVLPVGLAYSTRAFGSVLPTDTAVAVAAQSSAVTAADLDVARGAVTTFSDPRTYATTETALRALSREQVYAVVSVPPGLADGEQPSTVVVYVHGSIVPYLQPSKIIVNVMDYLLGTAVDSSVRVERTVVGVERDLSAYLVPTFLQVFVMLFALAYLPYNLAAEAPVFDRLRVESSIEAVVGVKLAYFAVLLVLPIAIFQAAAAFFGYGLTTFSAGSLAVYVLTFLYLGAVATAVTLLTRFGALGRMINVGLLLALLVFSGIFYPAGFFSPLRRDVVRMLPTHYSAVMARSFVLRDADPTAYVDWFAGLGALTLLCLGLLELSIRVYERRA